MPGGGGGGSGGGVVVGVWGGGGGLAKMHPKQPWTARNAPSSLMVLENAPALAQAQQCTLFNHGGRGVGGLEHAPSSTKWLACPEIL